ncbi:MAG TPA: tetratricopeptide repeat protein [Candidatus Limnocylindrales bacterium]|nr:tetratricopeptide repeat protein [Candidatus Limnocylindrales bacterium]
MTHARRLARPCLPPIAIALLSVAIVACGEPRAPSSPAGSGSAARASPPPSAPSAPSGGPEASAISSSPSSPSVASTAAEIARLEAVVAADPTDAGSQRDLGFALAQRVRETADPSLYAPAEAAFRAALRLRPDDAPALVGIAGIQLGKHEFAAGLETARRALALSPSLVAAHAAQVDALVELGRYDEADTAAGAMFGLSSDLSTLARVSYLAELRGRLPAALTAMRAAARAPGLAPENTAYIDALLGNLLVANGDPDGAATAYASALVLVPEHAPSLAGGGRLAVGAGHLDEAIERFEHAARVVPLPEYVIALGDAQTAAGQADGAVRSYKLARAEIQLFKAAGVVVDVDLALLEADHGDPAAALSYAMAALAVTPTVRAADAVGWALHRLGRNREALAQVKDALRLGSIDPILRYHAGAIEASLGKAVDARRDLTRALATDSGFSATGAAEARRLLASLKG